MSAPTRHHHGNGLATRLTTVGLVGISLIAVGALVACPTEDDGDDGIPTATFATATSAITEDASGTIGVALSADAGADGVAVQFGVVSDGTTAEDDDWQITTGSGVAAVSGSADTWTVDIPSGMRSATITITAHNDGDGGVVIFELQSGTDTGYSVGSANRHTLTIMDNDGGGGPTATFAVATSTITEEGASGTIGVALSADAGADGVAVQFGVVSDGTTAEDDDWQITTGGSSGVEAVAGSADTWTVTIPSGMRSATITVTAPDDADGDGGVVIFELQSGTDTGYSVGSANRHTLTIMDNDAEPVFSAASYSFSIGEGKYSTSSPGEVGTVSATNVTRYAITAGNTGNRFAIDGNEAITAVDELDFEDASIPNSYDLTVTVHNGAGIDVPSATALVTITVTDVEAGLADSVSYTIEIGEDDMFGSLNGVTASGTTLNLGPLSTVDEFDPTAFTITPTDSPFTLTKAAGLTSNAMLMATAADLDFEDSSKSNRYTLTVSATGATNSNRITLEITVTDVDYVTADDLTVREDADILALMLSPASGSTVYTLASISSVDTPNTPFSVAAGPPLPTALTVDPDQLAVEDAAKPDSYSDVVITIEIDGGELNNDVEIITVGTITVTGVPGFLNSQPTIFLREDGMFVAVGDTTITPATTLDLAETSEYTFVKGGFVPSNVDFTTGMMVTSDPAGGTATFPLSGTELTAGGTADDFEAITDTQRYSLPITDGTDTSATTTLTVEIADLQDGSADEPYKIDSVTELQSIDSGFSNEVITTALSRADSLAAHYLLTANLNVTGDSDAIANFDPIGDCGGDNCVGFNDNEFTGGFDGGGYTIANLTSNRSSLNGVGLFAIANGVSIRNLFLQDVDITGRSDVGGLVGRIMASSVRFVAVTGTLSSTSDNVGAIVGNSGGTNYFAVFGNAAISGTTGQTRALLTGFSSGNERYINSHAAGTIENSVIAANIIGNANNNSDKIFYNVYGRGEIKSNNSGLIGAIFSSSVIMATNVYWDTESSTQSMPVGVILSGELPTVEEWATMGITGLNTAGMQALTGAVAGTTNGSGWQTEFASGIDLDDDNDMDDDASDMYLSVRCDVDGNGTVDASEWLWDFVAGQYPALNCMPISLAEQRAANRQIGQSRE